MSNQVTEGPEKISSEHYPRIKQLSIQGGFLDELKLSFSSHLNCLIGGRGTGKTTVLEFIRYALEKLSPDEIREDQQFKAIKKLIENNLQSGQIQMSFETQEGLLFTSERERNQSVRLLNDMGKAIAFQSVSHLFNAEIYSQDQIVRIAEEALDQLALLDKFFLSEKQEITSKINKVRDQLKQNASDLIGLDREIQNIKEETQELPVLQERLKAYSKSGSQEEKEIQELRTTSEQSTRRNLEKKTLDQLLKLLNEGQGLLSNLIHRWELNLDPWVSQEILEKSCSENQKLFQELDQEIRTFLKGGVQNKPKGFYDVLNDQLRKLVHCKLNF